MGGFQSNARGSFFSEKPIDFYQFTISLAQIKGGVSDDPAVFTAFYRKPPKFGSKNDQKYVVTSGLRDVIEYIASFQLDAKGEAYLRSELREIMHPEDIEILLQKIKGYNVSQLSIYAPPEGTVMFPGAPLIRIEGPLGFVQLLETAVLNTLGYASLVATHANAIRSLVPSDIKLSEFGARRAQGAEAAMIASRSAIIGGFNLTSNVSAAARYHLPVGGTSGHAIVMAFEGQYEMKSEKDFWNTVQDQYSQVKSMGSDKTMISERVAFATFAYACPDHFVVVVDTYNVMESGLPNYIAVAKALKESGYDNVGGIRIDSGNLAELATAARKTLDEHGLQDAKIILSNDLDYDSISEILEKTKSGTVNGFGVGTNLVTCAKNPSLGIVYKLSKVGETETMKIAGEKTTYPGRTNVVRVKDKRDQFIADIIVDESEVSGGTNGTWECYHAGSVLSGMRGIQVQSFNVQNTFTPLLRPVIANGIPSDDFVSIEETTEHVASEIESLKSLQKRDWPKNGSSVQRENVYISRVLGDKMLSRIRKQIKQ